MITVKFESSGIRDGDNINFNDVNPGDFLEFSRSNMDKEYSTGDDIRVGPLTGIVWAIDEDSFLMKVTGNPFSSKKSAGKIYKVEYHYDFYDDYGDNPRSATFISSVLIHANSEDEAIDKVIEHNEDIWDKHYPYIDGDPYDFEVVGEWDSIDDYNAQYPHSNIPLLENKRSKKTESSEDSVFVMVEYTCYPESGMDADDFNPLFIMDAKTEAEAKKEADDYNWEHKDEVTRDHSYFYQEMSREEAYELVGDPNEDYSMYDPPEGFDEKYIPVREALEDDPEAPEQEYTSADTSINSSKLPALFRMVKFDKGSINLDFGGGKFDNVAEYLKSEYDATNLVYDPYNRSSEHNREVLNQIRKNGGADTVTCSNVLNVIKEPEARLAVIKNCKNYLKSGGTAYFTVYEGKGNGNEGSTKSGYQLNRKTVDYVDEIKSVFSNVVRKGKLIVAK